MRVLLVEDHAALARISTDLLRDVYGHEVQYAPNGRAALDLVAAVVPDIVLIDLNLPDMDGYELAAQLRANPRFDAAVLIALSGFGKTLNDAAATAAGIDAQFRKPMDFSLLATLKRRH